ncbi:metallophosphoesterase [Candidatus Pacearchaeota archaeon]|nr:metallophosphoesterase [Candidatus Pacearchaeota archaeon]
MKLLIVGDPHGVLPKRIPNEKFDAVIITGDLGKADEARKFYMNGLERERKNLPEIKKDLNFSKRVWKEISSSSLKVIKFYSKIAPVYLILGNVANKDSSVREEEKKYKIKLPHYIPLLRKMKNVNISKNVLRNFNGIKIGFVEHFLDVSWVNEFKPKDYNEQMKKARKQTKKAEKILKRFGKVDVLVCHAPPYGILDKVNFSGAPKNWQGKHAGSKVVLSYIKKYQPKYVFCGHIHEGKGVKKLGKTIIHNVGCCGDYLIKNI